MSFEPRSLLVTGGAGFIGSNFVHHWLARKVDCRVVVLDALTYAGNMANLADVSADERYFFVRGDICDEALVRSLMEQHKTDTVVHFAAESHVDRSILGPDDFIRTNVSGTHALLKVAKSLWLDQKTKPLHRFHHVSTDEVYGSLGLKDSGFQESSPYAPNSPYSASKAGSDHFVRAYFHTFGLNTTLTNCSNNYGPYHFPEKLIPLTIVNLLLGKALPVYGDGLQVRDWLHVEDHCKAIELAIEHGAPGEVYNIGGGSEATNIEIVRTLCKLVVAQLAVRAELRKVFTLAPADGDAALALITHVRDRPGHDRRYSVNYDKAAREIGYAPTRNLEEGLAATVEWYLNNKSWWQEILGRDYATWLKKNYGQ